MEEKHFLTGSFIFVGLSQNIFSSNILYIFWSNFLLSMDPKQVIQYVINHVKICLVSNILPKS